MHNDTDWPPIAPQNYDLNAVLGKWTVADSQVRTVRSVAEGSSVDSADQWAKYTIDGFEFKEAKFEDRNDIDPSFWTFLYWIPTSQTSVTLTYAVRAWP